MRFTLSVRAVAIVTLAAVAACSDGPSSPPDPGLRPSFSEEEDPGCGDRCEEESPPGSGPTPYQPVPGDTTWIVVRNFGNNQVWVWTDFVYRDSPDIGSYWSNTRGHYTAPGGTVTSIVNERRISESDPNEYIRVRTDVYSFDWKCPFSACWHEVDSRILRQADNGVVQHSGVDYTISWQPKP